MGVTFLYQTSQPDSSIWNVVAIDFGLPYFSISIGLNIFLTLMIVVRLILHARNTRAAVGIGGIGGLSKAIVTMLVESCALYTVTILLVLGSLNSGDLGSSFISLFLYILNQTQVRASPRPRDPKTDSLIQQRIGQVIAPLLIIRRVANKSALTSNTIASLHLSSFKTRSRGISTGGSGALPDGDPTSSVDRRRVGSDEPGIEVETRSDFHQDNI